MLAFGWASGNCHLLCKEPHKSRQLPTAHANGVICLKMNYRIPIVLAYIFLLFAGIGLQYRVVIPEAITAAFCILTFLSGLASPVLIALSAKECFAKLNMANVIFFLLALTIFMSFGVVFYAIWPQLQGI